MERYVLKAPDSLAEINLKDLITFSRLDQNNERQLMYKAFSLFMNVDKADVNRIPLYKADEALTILTKTLNSTPEERLIVDINGVRYGRIPNMDKLEFGEFADLDTFATPLLNGNFDIENAFQFMSVLWRPVVDEVKGIYSIMPFDDEYIDSEHWRTFQDYCPADIYASSIAFFLNLKIELLTAMKHYFNQVNLEGQESNLAKVGVGMEALRRMQQVNLSPLMKPLNILLQLPSIPLATMQTQEG